MQSVVLVLQTQQDSTRFCLSLLVWHWWANNWLCVYAKSHQNSPGSRCSEQIIEESQAWFKFKSDIRFWNKATFTIQLCVTVPSLFELCHLNMKLCLLGDCLELTGVREVQKRGRVTSVFSLLKSKFFRREGEGLSWLVPHHLSHFHRSTHLRFNLHFRNQNSNEVIMFTKNEMSHDGDSYCVKNKDWLEYLVNKTRLLNVCL